MAILCNSVVQPGGEEFVEKIICQALPRSGAVLHPFQLPAEVPEPPGHRELESATMWTRD